jgi:hypothetical protein
MRTPLHHWQHAGTRSMWREHRATIETEDGTASVRVDAADGDGNSFTIG